MFSKEDLDYLLGLIGTNVFVNYFEYFCDPDLSSEQIRQTMILMEPDAHFEKQTALVGRIRRIFEAGQELEALERILDLASKPRNRIKPETLHKAEVLLAVRSNDYEPPVILN